MYKFADKQIRFEDFETPIGMKLTKDNRWVQKAEIIPWSEIEKRYAKLFMNRKGNVAKPLRLALGSCIIQAEYEFSDEENIKMIQEHPYMQFFCGFSKYDDSKPPFDPSLMVYFRKRLTPEILGEINEMIITSSKEKAANENDDNNDKPEPPSNDGTMIIDATCAPANIKYPQDTELLNDAREATEEIIDDIHTPELGKKPRTYRKKARKDYLKFVRNKNRSAKEIRKSISKQLSYLRRNIVTIKKYLENGVILSPKAIHRFAVIQKIYEQQKYMYENHTHAVENRIVSLSQPHIRPIIRGKAKAKVEFGAKLDISVVEGYARLEELSFEAYNESTILKTAIERYKERSGSYPERILADKIYRNRENLKYCKDRGIRLSGPALGRPNKDEIRDKKQDYKDEADRIEVERRFSLAKRKCGLGLIMTRLSETASHTIALSIIVLNLRKVLCSFFIFSYFISNLFPIELKHKNFAFVQ